MGDELDSNCLLRGGGLVPAQPVVEALFLELVADIVTGIILAVLLSPHLL
ncbi:hypothetical protein [Natrinema caseinilyticum]